jgi:hypothetical protein
MSAPELHYQETGRAFADAVESRMFGKPCFKIGGKAFICYFSDCMVFKLQGDAHAGAMALKGAVLFDPSGKGRAMKEWVQVPFQHKAEWAALARAAYCYVSAAV